MPGDADREQPLEEARNWKTPRNNSPLSSEARKSRFPSSETRVSVTEPHSTIMPRGGAALPYNDFIYDNKSKTMDKWNIGTQRRIGNSWSSPALLKGSLVPLWVAELLEWIMDLYAKGNKARIDTMSCGNFPQYKR
jgi:hypothetical protein